MYHNRGQVTALVCSGHCTGESILCREGWRRGSSQMTLGRTCHVLLFVGDRSSRFGRKLRSSPECWTISSLSRSSSEARTTIRPNAGLLGVLHPVLGICSSSVRSPIVHERFPTKPPCVYLLSERSRCRETTSVVDLMTYFTFADSRAKFY